MLQLSWLTQGGEEWAKSSYQCQLLKDVRGLQDAGGRHWGEDRACSVQHPICFWPQTPSLVPTPEPWSQQYHDKRDIHLTELKETDAACVLSMRDRAPLAPVQDIFHEQGHTKAWQSVIPHELSVTRSGREPWDHFPTTKCIICSEWTAANT